MYKIIENFIYLIKIQLLINLLFKKMVLIGIAGKMGSGKDFITTTYIIPYIENILKEKILQFCFADQIKVNVMTKNNINYHDLYISKSESTRKLLQIEGTENGRNIFSENIWINYLTNWVDVFKNRGINNFIITDVRFKNEFEFIKNNGGIIIKINAPNRNHQRLYKESNGDTLIYNKLKNHISECDLDDISNSLYDYVFENDNDNDNIDNNENNNNKNNRKISELYVLLDKTFKK